MILEDAYVKFLVENDITQSQYLFLHLVYKQRPDLIRTYKDKFPSEDKSMIGKYMIDDLVKKGFVVITTKSVELTKKFYSIFINKHLATDEIFSIYPTHFNNNGTMIPLTATDRNVFANIYDEAIQSNYTEHFEIMNDIRYAIEKGILKIGAEKFLKSHYWKTIRPIRLERLIKEQTLLRADNEF